MKRILLVLTSVLALSAFAVSTAHADDKPADAGTAAPAKKHHKKKKADADASKSGSTDTTKK